MTGIHEAKWNMFDAIIYFSDSNSDVATAYEAYATTLSAFKLKVQEIEGVAQETEQEITSITLNKADSKKKVCDIANTTAAALFAYASSSGNNYTLLKRKSKYTYRGLFRLGDKKCLRAVQSIRSLAGMHVVIVQDANNQNNPLGPYGLNGSWLTLFSDAIDEYRMSITAPRNAIAHRVSSNVQLEELIEAAETILKERLDKIALRFKTTYPDFYREYLNSRKIIDPRTIHTQVAGTITDAATGNPIAWVRVSDTTNTHVTTCASDGSYSLKIPEFRKTHALLFKAEGYQDKQIVGVKLRFGQITYQDAQMIPEG